MPLYEYECQKCGLNIEKFQSINEDKIKNCPLCNGSLKLLISKSSFELKGSGWAKDLYSKKEK